MCVRMGAGQAHAQELWLGIARGDTRHYQLVRSELEAVAEAARDEGLRAVAARLRLERERHPAERRTPRLRVWRRWCRRRTAGSRRRLSQPYVRSDSEAARAGQAGGELQRGGIDDQAGRQRPCLEQVDEAGA